MSRFKLIFVCAILILADFFIVYKDYRFYRMPVAVGEVLEENLLVSGGPPPDGIPAIDDPQSESVAIADQYLDDQGLGILLERQGQAFFYPFQLLVWHQIVNETLVGQPLLITYDPLSGAGMVFERTVDGVDLQFGVSGKLLNSHLVMFDRETKSMWSQIKAESIDGEKIGQKLKLLPSLTTSWDSFKELFPKGRVLSRPSGIVRDYTRDPYRSYQSSHALWFPVRASDLRLESKSLVFGFSGDNVKTVYPRRLIQEQKLINDQTEGSALLLIWDVELETARAYSSRRSDGAHLTFKQKDKFVIDDQTSSMWNVRGQCVSGSLKGEQLTSVPLTQFYWFAWAAMYPQTSVFEIQSLTSNF